MSLKAVDDHSTEYIQRQKRLFYILDLMDGMHHTVDVNHCDSHISVHLVSSYGTVGNMLAFHPLFLDYNWRVFCVLVC